MKRADELKRLRAESDLFEAKLIAIYQRRNELICECIETGEVGVSALASLTGVTTTAIYKIRDKGRMALRRAGLGRANVRTRIGA